MMRPKGSLKAESTVYRQLGEVALWSILEAACSDALVTIAVDNHVKFVSEDRQPICFKDSYFYSEVQDLTI